MITINQKHDGIQVLRAVIILCCCCVIIDLVELTDAFMYLQMWLMHSTYTRMSGDK